MYAHRYIGMYIGMYNMYHNYSTEVILYNKQEGGREVGGGGGVGQAS